MTYHHVNCTKCGRKIRAVDMAIDLDELIRIYLKREKEKKNVLYSQSAVCTLNSVQEQARLLSGERSPYLMH